MANVTSAELAARLLRSAKQAAAIKAGEMEPVSVVQRKVCERGEVERSDADYIRVDGDESRM